MLFIFRKPLLSFLFIILISLIFGLQYYINSSEVGLITNSYFLANFLPVHLLQVNIGFVIALLFLLSVFVYAIVTIFDIPKNYAYLSPLIFFLYSLWYCVTVEQLMIEDILCFIFLCGMLYNFSFIVKVQAVSIHLFYIGILFLLIVALQPLLIWLFVPLLLLFILIRIFSFFHFITFIGGALTTIIWIVSYIYFFEKPTILETWFRNILTVRKNEISESIYNDNAFYFVATITFLSIILTGNYLLTKYIGQKETERKSILLMYFLFFTFLCYIPLYFTATRVFPFLLLIPFSLVLPFFISWTPSKVYQQLFLWVLLLLPFICCFGLPYLQSLSLWF